MTNREAIRDDLRFAARIPESERCTYCSGTGNELYSMYRKCRCCQGTGVSRGNEGEQRAKDEAERLAKCRCCKCGRYAIRCTRMNDAGRISGSYPSRYFCEQWPDCVPVADLHWQETA